MRVAILVAVTTMAVTASIVVAPHAEAAVIVQIKTVGGLCLDNKGALTAESNPVQIYTCNGTAAQQWTGSDDGTIRVQGKCLSTMWGMTWAGTALVINTCTGAPSQYWQLRPDGSFASANTTACIENVGNAQVNGNPVRLATCNGGVAQRFGVLVTGAPPTTTVPPTTKPPVTTTPPTTTVPPTTKPPVTTTPPTTTVPPTTTPPTTTPPAAGNPSGVAAPVGNLPGWKQIFVDDFSKPSATGSWANQCDPTKIVYTGNSGQKWRTYPTCYKDTYQKRPYRSDAVLSTHDSVLDYSLRQVDGIPAGASVSPVINAAGQNQTYGRYTARFKVDNPTMSEYYVAWLLWPQSERWPADGEFDFPEGSLAGSPGGFHHFAGQGSCTNGCQAAAASTGAKFTDWHTYTIEWSPGRIKYILDQTVVLDSTSWVPSGPMRWELQTETNGSGNHSGHLLLDWVSVYSWTG